jgi:hypothetical protein
MSLYEIFKKLRSEQGYNDERELSSMERRKYDEVTSGFDIVKNILINDEVQKKYDIYDLYRKKMRDICRSPTYHPVLKVYTLLIFCTLYPDYGYEMMKSWGDILRYVSGEAKTEHIICLRILIRVNSPHISLRSKIDIALTLYNNSYISECYGAFIDCIQIEPNFDGKSEAEIETYYAEIFECCKFLLMGRMVTYEEIAEETMTNIITNISLSSKWRYEKIITMCRHHGISTFLSNMKLAIPYNEELIRCMQTSFFLEKRNDVRYRILSGQSLMELPFVEGGITHEDIVEELFCIAKEMNFSERTRADALDVITRYGTKEEKKDAMIMLDEIGNSEFKDLDPNSLRKRMQNIYENRENIHRFQQQTEEFIFYLVKGYLDRDENMTDADITELTNSFEAFMKTEEDVELRTKILCAWHRINVDMTRFTNLNITLHTIILYVWKDITGRNDIEKTLLKQRLIEELIDMGDDTGSCTTGHVGRIANIYSGGYGYTISISFRHEIEASLGARINAKIMHIEDDEEKESICLGMLANSDPIDRERYTVFAKKAVDEIEIELYEEYVLSKLMRKDDFTPIFRGVSKKWLDIESNGEELSESSPSS